MTRGGIIRDQKGYRVARNLLMGDHSQWNVCKAVNPKLPTRMLGTAVEGSRGVLSARRRKGDGRGVGVC